MDKDNHPTSTKTLGEIRELVGAGKYHYSTHAGTKVLKLGITDEAVKEVVLTGELLEHYTEDARGWAYLVLGFPRGRAVHVEVGFNHYRNLAIIITVYEPKPPKWITPRQRGSRV
jgi:hypothetical protein